MVRPLRLPTSKPPAASALADSAHIHQPDTADPKADHELTVTEVAAVLGISTNVVYYWIERNHIDARRGPAGRLYIPFNADIEAACRARIAASVHLPMPPRHEAAPMSRQVSQCADALLPLRDGNA